MVNREVTEAHYLHERHGLEAVLRPPVGYPTALAWVPKREELVVATREGQLHNVDPILGTRVVADNVGEAAALDIHKDRKRFVVVSRNGTWKVGEIDGPVLFEDRHQFLSHIDAFFFDKYVVMLGNEVADRFVQVFVEGKSVARVRIPKGVVAVPEENKLLLARSTAAGLEVTSFGKNMRFDLSIPSTAHVLKRAGSRILGLTQTGIAIWTTAGGAPHSMRMPELTAADIADDGSVLGLGTRHGAVALARVDKLDGRAHPDLVKAFDCPVTTVSFSQRGRWLATGGDRLQLWTWED